MTDDTELIKALEMSLEMVKDISDMQLKSKHEHDGAAEEQQPAPPSGRGGDESRDQSLAEQVG